MSGNAERLKRQVAIYAGLGEEGRQDVMAGRHHQELASTVRV